MFSWLTPPSDVLLGIMRANLSPTREFGRGASYVLVPTGYGGVYVNAVKEGAKVTGTGCCHLVR